MRDKYYYKDGDFIKLNFTVIEMAFIAIFFFTLLNGLFNSLYVASGHLSLHRTTFLFNPADLHADLLKYIFSFYQGQFPEYFTWDELHQKYYLHTNYGGIEQLKNGTLSSYGGLPMGIMIAFGLGQLIFIGGPKFLVIVFYSFVIISIAYTIKFFTRQETRSGFFFFLITLLSYPILFLLTRGHIYSFITASLGIFFIYLVLKKHPIYLPILLLAIMINLRPNMLILGTLFLVYGFRESIKATLFVIILGAFGFIVSLLFASRLFEGYNLQTILLGFKMYSSIYIIGAGGDSFNNSLLGAIKLTTIILNFEFSKTTLLLLNKIVSFSMFMLLPIAMYLNYTKRLLNYDFAFVVTCIYILATPSLATYHLYIIFGFLFYKFTMENQTFNTSFLKIILIVIIFVLSPKNYIYNHGVSIEIILNPLVMLSGVLLILNRSYRSIVRDEVLSH